MELVDRLLVILSGPDSGTASRQLIEAGYSDDEVRGAWNFARAAAYTEPTGLATDRLTPAGQARATAIRSRGEHSR